MSIETEPRKKRKSVSKAENAEETAPSAKKRRKTPRTEAELAQLVAEQSPEAEETEVISHKEKRKRKREKEASATEKPRPARSQFGVWIGNLAFATPEDKLAGFLTAGGCQTPSRFNMPRGKSPHEKNRGFAYVDFEDEASANLAVSLSEGHLDGRKLLIKLKDNFEGRPAGAAAAAALGGRSLSKSAKRIADRQKNQPVPCLFLGNLGFEVDEERIRNMFEGNHLAALKWVPKAKLAELGVDAEESAGEEEADDKAIARARASVGIRKIRLGTFEDSGKCKGWAFVDFKTIQEATNALLNPRNHHLANRDLVLEYATLDAVRRGGGIVPRTGKRPLSQRDGPVESTLEEAAEEPAVEEAVPAVPRAGPHKERAFKKKPTPGAALARAKRASAGIVQAKGTKTVF